MPFSCANVPSIDDGDPHFDTLDSTSSVDVDFKLELDATSCLIVASQPFTDAAKDASSYDSVEAAGEKDASQPSLDAAIGAASLEPKKTKTLHAKAAIPLTDDAASCLPNFNAVISWIDSACQSSHTFDG